MSTVDLDQLEADAVAAEALVRDARAAVQAATAARAARNAERRTEFWRDAEATEQAERERIARALADVGVAVETCDGPAFLTGYLRYLKVTAEASAVINTASAATDVPEHEDGTGHLTHRVRPDNGITLTMAQALDRFTGEATHQWALAYRDAFLAPLEASLEPEL